jgi:hypothetical protein
MTKDYSGQNLEGASLKVKTLREQILAVQISETLILLGLF